MSDAVQPPAHLVDGGDRRCVALLLELRTHLAGLADGTVVHIITTDPAAPLDLPAWCHLTGHTYLGQLDPTTTARPTYAVQVRADARATHTHHPWHRT